MHEYIRIWCLFFAVPAIILIFSNMAISREVEPILKDGNCPSNYATSGKYCVPNKNSHFAITKVGNCPSDYQTNGKYCVATSNNARFIMKKVGNCPSGFRTMGEYCVQHN